ncbi:hypothetical protein ACVWZM_004722 [Bradyrhizobium sp. USDA 4501]
MQAPIAEVTVLLGDCPHALAKTGFVCPEPFDISWSCGSSRWLYAPVVRPSRRRLGGGVTAFRFPADVTTSFPRGPSRPRCPAWRRLKAASAVCSHRPGLQPLGSDTCIPPNFAFHLLMLASLTPCLRHSSATDAPASCSFKIPMICSSEKRDCASCSGPCRGPERTSNWIKPVGQDHQPDMMKSVRLTSLASFESAR